MLLYAAMGIGLILKVAEVALLEELLRSPTPRPAVMLSKLGMRGRLSFELSPELCFLYGRGCGTFI